MNKAIIFSIFLIILSIIIGIIVYPSLPEKVISHWNSAGEANGFMPKFWGIFLLPIILIGMFLLFLLIPAIDPLKKNIKKFRGTFDIFVGLIMLFLFYIYILSLMANFGVMFNMSVMIVPALAVLFFYIGILLEKSERNWFIGIRTPWTLSSDRVWKKTHKLGAVLFKISAVICLLGLIFPEFIVWFILVSALLSAIILFVYSYLMSRNG